MKIGEQQKIRLWVDAEKVLTKGFSPEAMRTSGLLAAQNRAWSSALLRLEEAVHHGVQDLQTLDALGEAAYQSKTYQRLLPFRNLYRDPLVAIHMARALTMLGQSQAAHEFLNLAPDSILKSAVIALTGVKHDIETSLAALIAPLSRSEMVDVNFVEYWQALAPVADAAGRKDLVLLAERRLKALAYSKPVIHYNQALRFLADGEFRAGWKLHDWRLMPDSPCMLSTAFEDFSMWEGEFLSGKRLLVVLENGFGDQIFGLRYLQALLLEGTSEDQGAKIEVVVGPELFALVQASFPSVKVHDLQKVHETGYWQNRKRPDFWTYCLSIPCRTDLFEPVQTAGYLSAPENLTQQYRGHLPRKAVPVYGITWHGDIRTPPMRTRAYTLQEFLHESEILKSPCVLVCLQKDATPDELAKLESETQKAGCELIVASSTLLDFAHTAAWISCVDKVWSCDTAVAHLAGALGVSANVMIRNKSIWCWRCDPSTQKAVWYDSCQIKYALTPAFSYMFDLPS